MHLEILLEEQSMENVINALMIQLVGLSERHTWKTHPHNGKDHLLKRLPVELRAYQRFILSDWRILVVLDQDKDDCKKLKQQIVDSAREASLAEHTIVRIAVAELESWFLGDAAALEKVFPRLVSRRIGTKARYREPDKRPDPDTDLRRELAEAKCGSYYKLRHSTEIGSHLNIDHNRSKSFQITVAKLRELLG